MTASPDLRDGALLALGGGVVEMHIPVVGPTEPLHEEQGDDMATVTELHPATENADTQPLPRTASTDGETEEQNDENPDNSDNAPSSHNEHADAEPVPEQDEPAPAALSGTSTPPPAASPSPDLEPPQEPQQLPLPEKPEFTGAGLVDKLFYASIAFSAIGQIMFWGTFFETFAESAFPGLGSTVPWVIALALGGVMEAGMVVFSDLGFDRRDGDSRAWVSWFTVGVAIACGCIGINVAHWWGDDPTAAVTFGAVGAIGFIAHLAKGLNKSQRWIDDRRAAEAENQRRQEQFEAQQRRYEETLEREREHRRRLELQQAAGNAVKTSTPVSPQTASASKTKPKRTAPQKATRQKGPRKATFDDARELLGSQENHDRLVNAEHKAAELRNLLKGQQLEAPHRNTLSNWLPQLGVAS